MNPLLDLRIVGYKETGTRLDVTDQITKRDVTLLWSCSCLHCIVPQCQRIISFCYLRQRRTYWQEDLLRPSPRLKLKISIPYSHCFLSSFSTELTLFELENFEAELSSLNKHPKVLHTKSYWFTFGLIALCAHYELSRDTVATQCKILDVGGTEKKLCGIYVFVSTWLYFLQE